MPAMLWVIEALQADGIRNAVKVMVGGALVTEKFAPEIGAYGYAPNAGSGVDKLKELFSVQHRFSRRFNRHFNITLFE